MSIDTIERRFVMTLKLQADTEEDLLKLFDHIHKEVKKGLRESISGGVRSGFHLYTKENPDMTHEKFYDALRKDQDEVKELLSSRRKDDKGGQVAVKG